MVDAGAVVAALAHDGDLGSWAEATMAAGPLFAPHGMPAEVANVLRRAVMRRELAPEVASLAHRDLGQLRVRLVPYAPFAERVWELRDTVSSYDAWYVALAETLDAPLATVDVRLSRARGPRCRFVIPYRDVPGG